MTSRKKWTIAGVLLLALVGLAFAFAGDLAIVLANQEAEGARLAAELGIDGDEQVAEIGAGSGKLTVAIAQRLPRGRMYSTELGYDKLNDIRTAVSSAGLRNVDVRAGAPLTTNLPDDCCDAIFMRTVYHHFTDPPAMVEALHAALKPGGQLAIIEFEPRGLWRFLAPEDVPQRGGHGVPEQMLMREVTSSGQFRHVRTVDDWVGRLYLIVFGRM